MSSKASEAESGAFLHLKGTAALDGASLAKRKAQNRLAPAGTLW
jgi:hypothetical protein